jgi:hypothetical protein
MIYLDDIANIDIEHPDLAEGTTLMDMLKELCLKVWFEGEGFSGKRPFGNSGWRIPVYQALVKHGAIEGFIDEEGDLQECDTEYGDEIIQQIVLELM